MIVAASWLAVAHSHVISLGTVYLNIDDSLLHRLGSPQRCLQRRHPKGVEKDCAATFLVGKTLSCSVVLSLSPINSYVHRAVSDISHGRPLQLGHGRRPTVAFHHHLLHGVLLILGRGGKSNV